MAANEKYNDLGLDGLESETLLHDEDSLSGLDDLDNFELDSDLDLNLDDVMADDDPSADDLDNLDNLDYSGVESDNDAAVSGDDAPIESDMSDSDIVDYPDAIDTTEPTEVGEDDLSDDDLDLSLEANLDDEEDTAPITPDISDDDIANFDSDSFDDGDESDDDDDDDDAYGVDLKIGPVTIAFTQVVEPEESADENDIAADDDLNDFGDFGDADLSADDDVLEEETELASEGTDESFADENEITDTEAELADDFSDIDELTEEESVAEEETNNEEENYDISSDDDLEFDVEQDDALSDIDIDDVLEQNGDDSGKMLNIPMPHEDELVVDEEQNAFLSSETEDVMSDFADGNAADASGMLDDIESTEESGEADALTELENSEIDDSSNGISDDLTGFDETIDDLNSIGGADSNLISDDDLNALEESMPTEDESAETDENMTEASLAGDVIVDEELAETISESEDDDRIALDGDEDLGIDLENAETEESDNIAADESISLDEDLPDTLDDIADTETITEGTSDESDIITDELPSNDGSVDDLDVDDIPAPATFDEDDEDETIGLSGDELDNILVDADMSEAEMVDVDIPPTDEELAESINIPEDPSFENDDEFLSDEELAASVTIPGENESAAEIEEPSVVDNNIMTNGDLDLYENVDENGGIIDEVEDTKIISDNNGVEELSEHTIVVPAADDTLTENVLAENENADMGDTFDDAALETDTLDTSIVPNEADDISIDDADIAAADQNVEEDESETIDLSSFDADLDVDDNIDTDSQNVAEDESETIDMSSFDADLEPTDGIADFNVDDSVSDEDMNAIADELEDTKIDISEEETNQIYDSLQNEEESQSDEVPSAESDTELKQDIKNVLTCLDSLLGALPEEKIKEFAESKEFEAYRRLFEQLDIKH